MRMRAFTRDAIFVIGLYNIVVGALFFFLLAQMLELFHIVADVETLTPIIRIAALFLFVFGVGYLFASRDVTRSHLLLFIGLLQNAGLAGVVAWTWLNTPDLVPNACLLPAGLSALFAVIFLIAWPATLVESRLQQRRARRTTIVPMKPAGLPSTREPIPAEPRPEPSSPEEVEAKEVVLGTEPADPDLPPGNVAPPEPPEQSTEIHAHEAHEPALRPLAHRDRSGSASE